MSVQPLAGYVFAATLIAATLPFVISIAVSLRGTARPRDVRDYFLYERRLTPALFLRTSVGYSLQAAAIFLFIDWTVSYGPLRALIVPLAWGAGYWFVGWMLHSGRLDTFLGSVSTEGATVHGFIASKLKRGRKLVQWILALTTVTGLGGTLIVEADYTTTFVRIALGFPAKYDGLLEVAVLAFCGFYVLWGGFKAAVDTDLAQIPAAYLGLGLSMLLLLEELSHARWADTSMIALLACALFVLVLRGRYVVAKRSGAGGSIDPTFVILAILSFVVFLVAIGERPRLKYTLDWWPEVSSTWGFGVVGLISLILANFLWQFIDLSSLQRLQSVRVGTAENGGQTLNKSDVEHLRHGLRWTGVETAVGWIVAILFALTLRLAGYAPGDTFGAPAVAAFILTLKDHLVWILPILTFGVVCFMLSTIDTLIAAIAFVSYEDLRLNTAPDLEAPDAQRSLNRARWTTLISLAVLYVAYLGLQHAVKGENIAPVLYAVYAVQASIGVVILAAFFAPERLGWLRIFASAIGGWVAAVLTALIDPPGWPWLLRIMPIDSWYVFPPLAAFLASLILYLLFGLFNRVPPPSTNQEVRT